MNLRRSRRRSRDWTDSVDLVETYAVVPGPDGVRAGRKHVEQWVAKNCGDDLAVDAALVAGELLANAHQHGAPPVTVRLATDADRVRLEVSDASPRWPIVGPANVSSMTGRGLTLVDSVSASWGVRREEEGGKTIWCELSRAADTCPAAAIDIDALLAGDEEVPIAEPRYTIVLGDVPTRLLIDAKAHVDNLVREFSLAAGTGERSTRAPDIPEHLANLITTVVHGFSDAREAIKRQALAAAQHDLPRAMLTLHVPLSAADAGEAYLAALDEADAYARASRLLTLETPPEHRLFRRWYVEALVRQLRSVAAGEPPGEIEPFERRLLAEVRTLSAAQRITDRAARLQRVTAALARARTPEDVASVVVFEAVSALGASGGGLLLPAADGEHLAVPGVIGYGDQLVGQFRAEPLDAPLPAATAIREGRPIWLESREERDEQFPALRGFEPATVAMCTVPLVVGQRTLGALRFSFSTSKLFDEAERSFVTALATQTAQTLLRTETYEAEREAALGLQRALLPQAVAEVPDWDVAAYYNPAGGQEVGGDFYDVVPTPDGRIAAIVGDVMGRGVQAAAAMAELRSVTRAYVVDDPDPATVFRRVDAFCDAVDYGQLATVLYFLVEPGRGIVEIISAGHLPPLLVSAGQARLVDVPRGLPFGCGPDERIATTVGVPSGTALVAITDGLVERRGEDIDVGINRLLDATSAPAMATARAVLSRLLNAGSMQRARDDDDITILVLRHE